MAALRSDSRDTAGHSSPLKQLVTPRAPRPFPSPSPLVVPGRGALGSTEAKLALFSTTRSTGHRREPTPAGRAMGADLGKEGLTRHLRAPTTWGPVPPARPPSPGCDVRAVAPGSACLEGGSTEHPSPAAPRSRPGRPAAQQPRGSHTLTSPGEDLQIPRPVPCSCRCFLGLDRLKKSCPSVKPHFSEVREVPPSLPRLAGLF